MGIHLIPRDNQSGTRFFDGVAQPEPGCEGDAPGIPRRNSRQIQHYHPESACLQQEIRCFQRMFRILAAANPEQLGKIDPRLGAADRIERVAAIDERAAFREPGGAR